MKVVLLSKDPQWCNRQGHEDVHSRVGECVAGEGWHGVAEETLVLVSHTRRRRFTYCEVSSVGQAGNYLATESILWRSGWVLA